MSENPTSTAIATRPTGQAAGSIDPTNVFAAPRAFAPTQRIGVPGYSVTGGYILPNEADARLTGRERYKLFSENLANVSIIGTGVRYFLDLIAGAGWSVEPADDSDAAAEVAEWVEMVLNDMETPYARIVRRAAMYKFYGFSVQEWTAISREDGRIGFADVEPRPQQTIERWDIDGRGWVRGIVQRNPNTGQEIYLPRDKLLYVVDDSLSDSPEGLGLFRHAIRGAAGVRRFEDLEHWGFETDLQGIPVGRAPLSELEQQVTDGTMTRDQANAAKAVIQGFIENHIRGPKTGMMLDSRTYETTDDKQAPSNQRLWDLELLKSGGTSHDAIDNAIKRKTFELARLLGVEHLLIGADGGGSLALHQSSTKRLHGMVNSCLGEISDAANKQLVRPLLAFNGIPVKLRPKMVNEKVEYRTVEEVTGALQAMAAAGNPLMPDDPAIGEVRDLIGLSRPDIESQIMAGLIAMGATDQPDETDDEAQQSRGKGSPKGKGSAGQAKRPSGARRGVSDPNGLTDALSAYLERNKVDA